MSIITIFLNMLFALLHTGNKLCQSQDSKLSGILDTEVLL